MVFAVSGFSMPIFWLGFVLVYVFAISRGLAAGAGLPADGAAGSGRSCAT